jgi:erythronate-4-phosphate dehydrogenase
VAGYSDDGKRNGTYMVYDAFCQWSGRSPHPRCHDPGRQSLTITEPGRALEQVLEATCFVERHDRAMRALVESAPGGIAPAFDRLRKDYPYRRDFHAWDLQCDDPSTAALLDRLGFEVNNT